MWPDFVEELPEVVEAALLGPRRIGWGPGGRRFEVFVHPFMSSVLCRARGLDEFGANPELQPPDAELRESAQSVRGEGRAVVGADALGQPVGTEQATQNGLGRLQERAVESVAREEIARVGILDGQRIAVRAIAEFELAFEVDRPDDIGSRDRCLRSAGMRPPLGPSVPPSASVALQNTVERRDGGDLVRRIGIEQELVEFGRTPAPRFPQLENLVNERGIGRVRTGVRSSGQACGRWERSRSPSCDGPT